MQINGRTQAIDELRSVFDSADMASPGIADEFVAEIIGQLLGRDLPYHTVDAAIQKTKRLVFE
jgi:hypothetical protein